MESSTPSPRRSRRHPLEVSATPEAQAVRTAVTAAGGSPTVGRLLGVTYQTVQKWMAEPQRIRGVLLRQLVKASGYQVPLVLIRPDLYGGLSVRELGYVPPLEPQG